MRLHLTLALITALLLVLTFRAAPKHRFDFTQVVETAQRRAGLKYVPPVSPLPPQLKNLTPQQQAGIFWDEKYRLWRSKGLPFQVDFYHISKDIPGGPQIFTVDRKGQHTLGYSPTFFNFLNLNIDPPLSPTLPYGGFYLRYPINDSNSLDGFFTVQSTRSNAGGGYFRVIAKNQVYGLSARALAINTETEDKKEEFPDFTRWWLYVPAPGANEMVMDALLESPSATGAYEFKVRPGAVTSVDVHAVLFFRQPVQRLGLAPFSSMYLFGENAKDHLGDSVHPEIHDSDGALVHAGNGEWIWRSLQQRPDHQIYNFIDENPKGFGLIQRDRDIHSYQDLDNKYNVRPSAWVTPRGNWGKGKVQLIQLNAKIVNTDNVVLLWNPDQPVKAGDRIEIDYNISFYMNDANLPPLAYCKSTLINSPAPPPPAPPPPKSPAPATKPAATPAKPAAPAAAPATAPVPAPAAPAPPSGTTPVQFVLDFMGDGIENIPPNQTPDLDLDLQPPGTFLRESQVEKNGYDNSWRATFTIYPAKPHVPTELRARLMPHGTTASIQTEIADLHRQIDDAQKAHDDKKVADLRDNILPKREAALKDASTHPLTETWTYTWHQ